MALMFKGLDRLPPEDLDAMQGLRRRFLAGLQPDQTGWMFSHDQG
jgi:hypothetical protein